MKTLQALTLSILVLLVSLPIPVFGATELQVVTLPDAMVGGVYQASIPDVLRDRYGLKLSIEGGKSIFRWSLAEGHLPIGLVLRPSGTISGTPRLASDEPYRFHVKVIDIAYAGSDPLILNIALLISNRRIRLTEVQSPKLIPIESPAERTDRAETEGLHSQNRAPVINVASRSDERPNFSKPAFIDYSNPVANTAHSFSTESKDSTAVDTSYDYELIRPLVESLKVKPPVPIPQSNSGKKSDKDGGFSIDVAREKFSGDKIRGPADIRLENVNVLRYEATVGQKAAFPPAPDLRLPFIPPIPGQPQKSTPGGAVAFAGIVAASPNSCPNVADCFADFVDRLNAIERDKTANVNTVIINASQTVNLAGANLIALVSASDSILNSGGGAQAVIDGLTPLIGTTAAPRGSVDDALAVNWPDGKIQSLLGELQVLENDLLALPTLTTTPQDFANWYQIPSNKAAYDSVRSRIDELQTQLNGLRSSGTEGTAFNAAQTKLRLWRPILLSVRSGGVAGFSRQFDVGCGFAFDTGKETEVKLIKRDRLAEQGAGVTEEEIVTVVCSSPLSVSAGFGFSNVDEREFVLVPSTKTVTANGQTTQTVISRFGFRNSSSFRTLPVLLLNTRIWEPNDTFALHASTGAAVDVKTGQGGTDLEYIVGPSISLWRSLFITPGLHFGRVNKLAGGFELDQEVPTGISEPPIEKTWKRGFVTTFTYKIK
ncbi:MAG TPA: hypothetical protein VJV03_06820 [Pyrinomonadaceae bacterium]|nr:hypothetical protein [Pyrinomonadaceae bacterium]